MPGGGDPVAWQLDAEETLPLGVMKVGETRGRGGGGAQAVGVPSKLAWLFLGYQDK